MGKQELVLVPNGDMQVQASTFTARVSSAILCKFSSVFGTMLSLPWAEGMSLARGEDLLLDLTHDDSEALKFVLQALLAETPASTTRQQNMSIEACRFMARVAILCDKYDCVEAIPFLNTTWCTRETALDLARFHRPKELNSALLYLVIAAYYSRSPAFGHITGFAAIHFRPTYLFRLSHANRLAELYLPENILFGLIELSFIALLEGQDLIRVIHNQWQALRTAECGHVLLRYGEEKCAYAKELPSSPGPWPEPPQRQWQCRRWSRRPSDWYVDVGLSHHELLQHHCKASILQPRASSWCHYHMRMYTDGVIKLKKLADVAYQASLRPQHNYGISFCNWSMLNQPSPGPLVGIQRDYSTPISERYWWKTNWGKESGWDMDDDDDDDDDDDAKHAPGQSSRPTPSSSTSIQEDEQVLMGGFKCAVTLCSEGCAGLVDDRPIAGKSTRIRDEPDLEDGTTKTTKASAKPKIMKNTCLWTWSLDELVNDSVLLFVIGGSGASQKSKRKRDQTPGPGASRKVIVFENGQARTVKWRGR